MSLYQPTQLRSHILQAIGIGSVLAILTLPAMSEPFEPMKYFQSAIAMSAFSIAINVLDECEGPLKFSEQKRTEGGQRSVTVSVVCEQFPADQDKMQRATVALDFDLTDEGEIRGAPSIEYHLP